MKDSWAGCSNFVEDLRGNRTNNRVESKNSALKKIAQATDRIDILICKLIKYFDLEKKALSFKKLRKIFKKSKQDQPNLLEEIENNYPEAVYKKVFAQSKMYSNQIQKIAEDLFEFVDDNEKFEYCISVFRLHYLSSRYNFQSNKNLISYQFP